MILAVDFGSTTIKAAVFDRRLRRLSQGQERLVHDFGSGGSVRIGIEAFHAALRGALTGARVRAFELDAVALTSQAQTFTLVDGRGDACMPFRSWQDTSATSACAALRRRLRDFAGHSSFSDLLPALQICQVRDLRPGPRLMPLLLPSYVARLWTGESVTDDNIAAMSGLYSLRARGWWPEALDACGLSGRQMPRLIPVGAVAALTTAAARRFGLPAGIPLVLAGNDQTAGAYAARLEAGRSLLLTMGTAQVAYACRVALPRPMAGLIRGPYPGGLYYRMAADSCGGSVVNWAETVIAGCDGDNAFFKAAGRAPSGSHGLVFEASMDVGRGEWRALGLHHTADDMARSILESLSERMAAMVRRVGSAGRGGAVMVSGGGSRQAVWRGILEERLGVRLTVTEANPLLGAARLALPHLRA